MLGPKFLNLYTLPNLELICNNQIPKDHIYTDIKFTSEHICLKAKKEGWSILSVKDTFMSTTLRGTELAKRLTSDF